MRRSTLTRTLDVVRVCLSISMLWEVPLHSIAQDMPPASTLTLTPITPRADASAGHPGSAAALTDGVSAMPGPLSESDADNASAIHTEAASGTPSNAASAPKPGCRSHHCAAAPAGQGGHSSPPQTAAPPMAASAMTPIDPVTPYRDIAVAPPLPTVTPGFKPLSGAPRIASAHPASSPAADAPITLDLDQVDTREAIRAFAAFTGLNIVTSEHVRGTVTLSLNAVPWRRAFATLLDTHGLAMRTEGNVIWVAPADEIAQRDKQRFEAQDKLAELEPLATRVFALRYQRAGDVRKLLAGSGGQRMLSKRGAVSADPRTDHLFVSDTPQRLEQIAALLAAIDVPPRQVLIESRIVEADASFDRNLGAHFALLGGQTGNGDSTHGLHGDSQGNLFDLTAAGLNGYQPAVLGVTLFSAGDSRELMLQLSALEAEGHGRIISSPRVVTADRVRALVEQGTELPYQAMVDTGVATVQFRRATLKLEVIPHITPDHHVMLDVDVTKDSVGEQTTAGPAIDTKHVQTQVEVENGGTVAIGGIYIQQGRNDTNGVPWLDHLPLIGALFRNHAVSHSQDELMIFITPTEVASGVPAWATDPGVATFVPGALAPATVTPDAAAPNPVPATPSLPPIPPAPGDALSVHDWSAELRANPRAP